MTCEMGEANLALPTKKNTHDIYACVQTLMIGKRRRVVRKAVAQMRMGQGNTVSQSPCANYCFIGIKVVVQINVCVKYYSQTIL